MGITQKKGDLRKIDEIATRLDDLQETLDECQQNTQEKLEEVRATLDQASEAIDDAVNEMTRSQPDSDTRRDVSPSSTRNPKRVG